MQETFVGRLRGACAVLPGSHVLAAVSGGADSTALLCFFCEIRETYPAFAARPRRRTCAL